MTGTDQLNDPVSRRCSKCRNIQPIIAFPINQRGPEKGIGRTNTCESCLKSSRKYKKARHDEEKENLGRIAVPALHTEVLPSCTFKEFLKILSCKGSVIDVEVRVFWSGYTNLKFPSDYRGRADKIAEEIGDVMGYFFRYNTKFDWQNEKTRYSYHCAQNKCRQQLIEKNSDMTKCRDKLPMATFECNGWLHISIDHTLPEVLIKMHHQSDHIPYCDITLPEEVGTLIKSRHQESVTQLWNDILRMYPNPQFTRRSVYYVWSKANESTWKLDEDQLKSAVKILNTFEENTTTKQPGIYQAQQIDLPVEDGFTALAWCLPDMLSRWNERIREVALDSAWETNGSRFELYALLGEAYGTGLPLGFCLLQTNNGTPGGIERYLTAFLEHFVSRWNLNPVVGLSDKNMSEINSMLSTVSTSKHQLCFWHALTAVKKRLSILRRTPAFYNVEVAFREFPWIDLNFVPVAQYKGDVPSDGLYVAQTMIPSIKVRLNGKTCTLLAPGRECMKIRLPPKTSTQILHDKIITDEDEDEDEEFELEHLMRSVSELDEDATDDEDGPDWIFEESEIRTNDPKYVFCPAVHRQQLLRLFTKHFCQHPLFPDDNGHHTAKEI